MLYHMLMQQRMLMLQLLMLHELLQLRLMLLQLLLLLLVLLVMLLALKPKLREMLVLLHQYFFLVLLLLPKWQTYCRLPLRSWRHLLPNLNQLLLFPWCLAMPVWLRWLLLAVDAKIASGPLQRRWIEPLIEDLCTDVRPTYVCRHDDETICCRQEVSTRQVDSIACRSMRE